MLSDLQKLYISSIFPTIIIFYLWKFFAAIFIYHIITLKWLYSDVFRSWFLPVWWAFMVRLRYFYVIFSPEILKFFMFNHSYDSYTLVYNFCFLFFWDSTLLILKAAISLFLLNLFVIFDNFTAPCVLRLSADTKMGVIVAGIF